MDPKQIVADGYDQIAEQYAEFVTRYRTEERAAYTSVLLERLPRGAGLLELGCGAGIPTTRQLTERFKVTGVDISAGQIEFARQNVPKAKFIHADMSILDLPPASFDGIAAFYSIIHVPCGEQLDLLRNMASWLRPGGLVVATMGARAIKTDFEQDWLGVSMYWSSFDSEKNKRMIEEVGLHIETAQLETAKEFDEPVTFLWVVARKPLCE
jgi:ubiquinone/menaquinone biosynthesis C-methylase UbiE